mmetsp:Transcript_56967/g.138790  ORF Transcript_56967/g.138790 Transcript_56967/m.138790 type:complete len:200 (+) Transcript_56967:1727-2326(+)
MISPVSESTSCSIVAPVAASCSSVMFRPVMEFRCKTTFVPFRTFSLIDRKSETNKQSPNSYDSAWKTSAREFVATMTPVLPSLPPLPLTYIAPDDMSTAVSFDNCATAKLSPKIDATSRKKKTIAPIRIRFKILLAIAKSALTRAWAWRSLIRSATSSLLNDPSPSLSYLSIMDFADSSSCVIFKKSSIGIVERRCDLL